MDYPRFMTLAATSRLPWRDGAQDFCTVNFSITPDLRATVSEIDAFSRAPQVLQALERARLDALHKLAWDPTAQAVAVRLDVTSLGAAVPAAVGSIRVVVTRQADGDQLERHPNSTQYLLAMDGPLETHVQAEEGWRIDRYGGDGAQNTLDDRWHVVPPGLWHKTVAPGATNWCVVAFHSALEVDDEYQ
jgi:hypothetical protein